LVEAKPLQYGAAAGDEGGLGRRHAAFCAVGRPYSSAVADFCRLCPTLTIGGQKSTLACSPFPENYQGPRSFMDSSQGKSLTWIHHFPFLGLKSSFAKGGLGKEKENDLKYSKVPPTSDFL